MKEVWKDIKGYEGLYKISNYGKVYSSISNKIRKPNRDKSGYVKIDLYKNAKQKTLKIHRLVAEAFIDNPHSYSQINHKDGNTTNNKVDNLEWCSPSQNIIHKIHVLHKNSLYPCKKIKCVELDKEFESIGEGARFIGCTQPSLSRAISKSNYTCGGFHWIFV